MPSSRTNPRAQAAALKALAKADAGLAHAIETIGKPVLRRREAGYHGLFCIICAQQLSVASAVAIRTRCEAGLGSLSAAAVMAAEEERLRGFGLSRPKIRALRAIAEAETTGALDFARLPLLSDQEAAAALTAVKGVGPWTAAIYLLFCEGRPDIWPPNDVALLNAWTIASGLAERPTQKAFDAMATERFAPHLGLAAHTLWTFFGHVKGRAPV